MNCRLALPSDLATIKELWYEAFEKHDGKESIDFYFDKLFKLENTFVLEDNNQIITTLQLNPHKLRYNDEIKKVSFVVGVATFEKFQGQGYMKILLNYAIEYAKNTLKNDFLILQAYNWDIYRPFGFYEAYYKSKFRMNKHNFVQEEKIKTYEYNSNKLLNIYNEYTKTLNGYEIRDKAYFDLKKELLAMDNVKIALSDDAYVFYEIHNRTAKVVECAFTSKNAFYTLAAQLFNTLPINTMVVESDCYNFNQEKELFMMVKDLNEEFTITDNLYISEWI